MSSKAFELIWIVPRVPWPTRCGASHANAELIRGMSELGYRIHLICFTTEIFDRSKSESVCAALGVVSLQCYRWPIILRSAWTRKFVSTMLSFFRWDVPLTVMPYTTKGVHFFLKEIFEKISNGVVVWDGLHPMGSLVHRWNSKAEAPLNIYRAHNIESAIWQDYMSSKRKWLRFLLRDQFRRMKRFERYCIERSDLTLFLQEKDEYSIKSERELLSVTSVVPISVHSDQDPTHRYVMRWRRIHSNTSDEKALHLLWLGGLDWWPNREALDWFAHHIWTPLSQVRSATALTLVGRGTEHLSSFSGSSVRGLGFVDDLSDVFAAADLVIAPIQSGSGVRVKALEALSHAVPCFGTSLGVRGIPEAGTYRFDSADDWVRVLSLLSAQECFIKGVMGARDVQVKNSRSLCARRFDELIHTVLRDKQKGQVRSTGCSLIGRGVVTSEPGHDH